MESSFPSLYRIFFFFSKLVKQKQKKVLGNNDAIFYYQVRDAFLQKIFMEIVLLLGLGSKMLMGFIFGASFRKIGKLRCKWFDSLKQHRGKKKWNSFHGILAVMMEILKYNFYNFFCSFFLDISHFFPRTNLFSIFLENLICGI